MNKLETISLPDDYSVQRGKYPQSRYTIFSVFANPLDGIGVVHLIARWEVNSLQDWQPNTDAIQAQAEAWKEQHNRLVDLFNDLADKHGKYCFEGADIVLRKPPVLVSSGRAVAMKADCIAYYEATGEWAQGSIYWDIEDSQQPEDVDYTDDKLVGLDVDTESSDPEDLEAIK